jgi:hypothetical protein
MELVGRFKGFPEKLRLARLLDLIRLTPTFKCSKSKDAAKTTKTFQYRIKLKS